MDRNRQVIDAVLREIWAEHITDEEARTLITVMDRVTATHHRSHG